VPNWCGHVTAQGYFRAFNSSQPRQCNAEEIETAKEAATSFGCSSCCCIGLGVLVLCVCLAVIVGGVIGCVCCCCSGKKKNNHQQDDGIPIGGQPTYNNNYGSPNMQGAQQQGQESYPPIMNNTNTYGGGSLADHPNYSNQMVVSQQVAY